MAGPTDPEPGAILGHHVILDLYGCENRALLDDKDGMQHLFHETAETLKCTIVNEVFHRFTPQGVSGVVVIAESHAARWTGAPTTGASRRSCSTRAACRPT